MIVQKPGYIILFLQLSFVLFFIDSLHIETIKLDQPVSVMIMMMLFKSNPNQITQIVLSMPQLSHTGVCKTYAVKSFATVIYSGLPRHFSRISIVN